MTSPRILLIDPDAARGQRLHDDLQRAGCVAQWLQTPDAALRSVEQGWSPDLVFCAGDDGAAVDVPRVLTRLHALQPALPVLVIARHASVQAAVQALQQGAADYLSAPLSWTRRWPKSASSSRPQRRWRCRRGGLRRRPQALCGLQQAQPMRRWWRSRRRCWTFCASPGARRKPT